MMQYFRLTRSRNLLLLLAVVSMACNKAKHEHHDMEKAQGFKSIFDGKTLNGWEGDSAFWRVENGILIGEIVPERIPEHNSFIIWQGGRPGDFELQFEYRISPEGNSGINYRSVRIDTLPYALSGYQFDIDGQNHYTGQNYEEKKRTTLAYHGQKVLVHSGPDTLRSKPLHANIKGNAWQSVELKGSLGDPDYLNTFIKHKDWNTGHLIVKGHRMQHYVNGVLMSEVTDNDVINRSFDGWIGVQVHTGRPMKIELRNIRLKGTTMD